MSAPGISLEESRRRFQAAAEALEVARAQELAALTDEQAFRIMRTLKLFAESWSERTEESGLVEQQRLFQRSRSHDRT